MFRGALRLISALPSAVPKTPNGGGALIPYPVFHKREDFNFSPRIPLTLAMTGGMVTRKKAKDDDDKGEK
jgi:hypothetical protein